MSNSGGGSAGGQLQLAEDDLAGRAVERDDVALLDDDVADARTACPSILIGLGPDHGRRAPAPGDDGGVADAARRGR